MYHAPYGPKGAESEQEDFWTDIMEGSDMLPGLMPTEPGLMKKETESTGMDSDEEDREWFEMSEEPESDDL